MQACEACAGAQHPPRALCIALRLHRAPGLAGVDRPGVVDSFTVVHRAPRPELEVPYVIARVRLDGGRHPAQPARRPAIRGAWRIDDRVQVDWVDLADGRALPVFVPAA